MIEQELFNRKNRRSHKIAKALLVHKIFWRRNKRSNFKDIKPTRSFDSDKEDDSKETSALDFWLKKPKPAL